MQWVRKNCQSREPQYFHENYFLFQFLLRRTSIPKLPEIRGMETFPGNQIHSHFYRRKDSYKDKRLLIVGAGNSAQDISIECSKIAKKVKKYNAYRIYVPYNAIKLRYFSHNLIVNKKAFYVPHTKFVSLQSPKNFT